MSATAVDVELPPLVLTEMCAYDVALSAWVFQGEQCDPVIASLEASAGMVDVALDTETMGKGYLDRYLVKVVSLAWNTPKGQVVVTLNPSRDAQDAERLTRIVRASRLIVTHNSLFDIPILVHAGGVTLEQCAKVVDTLVLARMLDTERAGGRTLTDLAVTYLGHVPAQKDDGLTLASALGSKKASDRFALQDIDSTAYLAGNRADALTTLALYPRVHRDVAEWTSRGYVELGIADRYSDPYAVIAEVCSAHTIALRSACVGVGVDAGFEPRYIAATSAESDAAKAVLDAYSIEPTKSDTLIAALHRDGVKTDHWSKTPKGGVKTDKKELSKRLYQHPSIDAWVTYRGINHALTHYVRKSPASVHADGNVHPNPQICGASKTGRMSYTDPPLQQFSAAARPVILGPNDGDELWSVDWTSIEPVLLAYLSGDASFIDAYESGVGVYEQVMEITGTTRKVSKVITLAFNYGQGAAGLAEVLGVPLGTARGYQDAIADRWSAITKYVLSLKRLARTTGRMYTVGGRVVSCSSDHVAVNYHIQGSAADLMHSAMSALAAKGAPEAVVLCVHDEIVTTALFAELVGDVMRTPPDYLVRAAGRVPVLKAEPEKLGPHWTKT